MESVLIKLKGKKAYRTWLSSKTDVLVATSAAGTGLDKDHVDMSYTLVVLTLLWNTTNSLGGQKRWLSIRSFSFKVIRFDPLAPVKTTALSLPVV